MLRGVFVFFLPLWSATPLGLPTYIIPCSRNDPNLNECALKSGSNAIYQYSQGDPARNLDPLDPLYVAEMVVYVPNKNGLKVIFKDNYFKGLSKSRLLNLKFDLQKKIITTDMVVNLDVKNTYEVSGKILVLPIRSSGDSSIKLKNTSLHMHIWYEHVIADDGKTYWNITNHDIKYEVGKAVFRLENFLNDKNIGDEINKLLNEMWREIVADVGPSISASLSQAVVHNLAVLLKQVPYDELMPE